MKIAFVVARRSSGMGGMETVINKVINNWNHPEDSITLIVSSRTKPYESWLEGVNFIRLWFQAWLLGYPFLILHLFWTLHKLKPDVIIAADSKAVKYCCWYRDLFAKKSKVVCWIHNLFHKRKKERIARINKADLYFCISQGLAEDFASFGINPKLIHVVYNPSDIMPVHKRADKASFLYLGRIVAEQEKCTNDFIRALAQLKGEWHADIIGDGKDKEKSENLAKQLSVYEKIKFWGWQKEPWQKVDETSCLVLTSETESFGMVLVEAMQRGIPCISSYCKPGPSEIVIEGVNGYFYPPRNIDALAQLMQKVIDSPQNIPPAQEIQLSVKKYSTHEVINKMRTTLLKKI